MKRDPSRAPERTCGKQKGRTLPFVWFTLAHTVVKCQGDRRGLNVNCSNSAMPAEREGLRMFPGEENLGRDPVVTVILRHRRPPPPPRRPYFSFPGCSRIQSWWRSCYPRSNERTNDILSTVLNLLPWVSAKRQPGKPVGEKWRFGNAGRCYSDGISMWRRRDGVNNGGRALIFSWSSPDDNGAARLEIFAQPGVRDIIVQRALPRRNFKNRASFGRPAALFIRSFAQQDHFSFPSATSYSVTNALGWKSPVYALRQTDGRSDAEHSVRARPAEFNAVTR